MLHLGTCWVPQPSMQLGLANQTTSKNVSNPLPTFDLLFRSDFLRIRVRLPVPPNHEQLTTVPILIMESEWRRAYEFLRSLAFLSPAFTAAHHAVIPSFPQLPTAQSYLPFLSCTSCSLTFLSSATHRAVLPSFPQLPITQSYLPFLSCTSCSLTFLSSATHHTVLPSFRQLHIVQSYLPFLSCPSVIAVICSCVAVWSVSPQEPRLSLQVVRTHLTFGKLLLFGGADLLPQLGLIRYGLSLWLIQSPSFIVGVPVLL